MKTTKFTKLLFTSLVTGFLLLPCTTNAGTSQLRITELMYDPNGNGTKEFIEIYNGSDATANLGGMSMYGVDFTFATGTTIGSGQYAVIVRNISIFRAANPSVRIIGQYSGKLQGGGESIRLMGNGTTLSRVDYTFGGAWPTEPRNGGPSLSLVRTNANESTPACWSASSVTGGSPGRANSVKSTPGGCDTKNYPILNTASNNTTNQKTSAPTTQKQTNSNSSNSQSAPDKTEKTSTNVPEQHDKKAYTQSTAKIAQQVKIKKLTDSAKENKIAIVLLLTSLVLLISAIGINKILHKRNYNRVINARKISPKKKRQNKKSKK